MGYIQITLLVGRATNDTGKRPGSSEYFWQQDPVKIKVLVSRYIQCWFESEQEGKCRISPDKERSTTLKAFTHRRRFVLCDYFKRH